MSTLTRWTQSFDDIAEKVIGGYEFSCEGRGYGGCLGFTRRTRRWTTVGNKHGGWLVCYGLNDDGTEDTEVVLVLCPVHRQPVTAPESADDGLGSGDPREGQGERR